MVVVMGKPLHLLEDFPAVILEDARSTEVLGELSVGPSWSTDLACAQPTIWRVVDPMRGLSTWTSCQRLP